MTSIQPTEIATTKWCTQRTLSAAKIEGELTWR